MIHKLHTKWVINIQSATEKNSENDLYELYNYCLHNIHNINGSIRWLYSASESILPGHRLATRRHIYQCFIRYVPLFHPCFWFVLCQSTKLCVFLRFFREFSHANVLFCVCFHARMTDFTFTLHLFKFPQKYRKWWFKRPKPVYWLNMGQFEPIWARGWD